MHSFAGEGRMETDEELLTSPAIHPAAVSPAEPASAREKTGSAMADWKDEISARVRAHRNRSSRVPANQPPLPGMEEALSPTSIAARVAERYGRLPSYRDMLAAQAARVQSALDSVIEAAAVPSPPTGSPSQLSMNPTLLESESAPSLPVREPCQPELLVYSVSSDSLPRPRSTPAEARTGFSSPETQEVCSPLTDPIEEALVEPSQPLPASVVTPRELVAPRKARPRLAEGPLRPDIPAGHDRDPGAVSIAEQRHPMGNSSADGAALRTAASQRTSAPPLPDPSIPAPREWGSIHLDTEAPIPERKSSSTLADKSPLPVASIEDRALAVAADCVLTLAAFLVFTLVFALCTTSLPRGRVALIGAGATLFAMWLLYQFLFFTLTDATPGMRYAKIALCTFDDENPTRSALWGRIGAVLLSALPLGLGFLWAVFDEDALGWHDRITRTYQRSYKEI
jgi:uncharacterized RDD family membrane protein YckC